MTTYCGKNCDDCTYREELSCTGCKSGPGRLINGDCKLAVCCYEKSHETCETCELKRNCGKWIDRGNMPQQRIDRRREEEEKQALIARRAPFLGKWLWVLFWVTIASHVLNFLSDNTIISLFSALEMPVLVGIYICRLFIVYILFVISKEHYFYKSAAIFTGVCLVISMLFEFLPEDQIWLLLLSAIIQSIIALVAEYYEYKANAEVILVVEGRLFGQWDNYWNWNIYSSIGIVASLVLVLLFTSLGSLLMLASSVGIVVARVKKIICMYRSAEAFRAKAQQ